MTKRNLLKYCKIGTVLLLDVIPVWFLVSIYFNSGDTDFAALGFMVGLVGLVMFNLWAFALYHLTNLIKRIWLREVVFYLVLLHSSFAPFIVLNLL